MKSFLKAVLLFLLGMAGQQILAQAFTDYDKNTDFSRYKTYAWLKEDIRTGKNPVYDSQLISRNICEHVGLELSKRGMYAVPDFRF